MKYWVQLELNIETEVDMDKLTSIMYQVIRSLERERSSSPQQPDFPSVNIKQITVKHLAEELEAE